MNAHQNKSAPSHFVARSFSSRALLLMMVGLHFLSITGLSWAGILTLADQTGDHQVINDRHQVILHHRDDLSHQHLSRNTCSVSASQPHQQDHVLPFSEEQSATLETNDNGKKYGFEGANIACSSLLPRRHLECTFCTFPKQICLPIENQLLAHWRCQRLNV